MQKRVSKKSPLLCQKIKKTLGITAFATVILFSIDVCIRPIAMANPMTDTIAQYSELAASASVDYCMNQIAQQVNALGDQWRTTIQTEFSKMMLQIRPTLTNHVFRINNSAIRFLATNDRLTIINESPTGQIDMITTPLDQFKNILLALPKIINGGGDSKINLVNLFLHSTHSEPQSVILAIQVVLCILLLIAIFALFFYMVDFPSGTPAGRRQQSNNK